MTIVLGLVSLVAGMILFAISASVIGAGNAAWATLGLFLVGVILIIGGLVGSRV